MFRCLVMRHAEAEDQSPSGLDGDRRLSDAGRTAMADIARALRHQLPPPDRIASSPLVRARETAEILAAEYAGVAVECPDVLQPGAVPLDVIRWLAGIPASSLVIVGHEPDMGRLVSYALASSARSFYPMRKAEACLLEFPAVPRAGNATLEWALEPSQLIALANAPGPRST